VKLCDTGIFVGAFDPRDDDHGACLAAINDERERLVTTWPCITEAMYLIGERAGGHGQERFRQHIEAGIIQLLDMVQADALRCCVLMRKYRDAPMDFADASLVVAAEALNITRILTLDSHFYAYRIHDTLPFEVLP
jgi:uncharacterized protein